MTTNERMHELMDKFVPDGDFSVDQVVTDLHEHLVESDPELLSAWLDGNARALLYDHLRRRLQSKRATAHRRMRSKQFADAAARFEDGDAEPISVFATTFVVNDDLLRRPLGEMTGADHRYVASTYRASEKRSAMFAAAHEAVAKKVGAKRTSDVFSPEQYLAMFSSFVEAA